MMGNPNVVGEAAAFNWTVVDRYLAGSASRFCHAVLRPIAQFPGRPLKIPSYLYAAGIEMRETVNGTMPYYGDPILLEAMQQFIASFGQRYDKDKRLAFLQAGLLGFWGEWHTFGNGGLLPDSVKELVVGWYTKAFPETKLQVRYPRPSVLAANWGFHDDSFAFQTLDGVYTGGHVAPSYFWPSVIKNGGADFWKRSVMGGETRPELQKEVFEPTYAARTFQKQSFMDCVNVTHTTYSMNHGAFRNGGYIGEELSNALFAHARMGYNFYVSQVAVKTSATAMTVDVDVTVTQIGVAPFYFDLSLVLECFVMTKQVVSGVETIIEAGAFKTFSFARVPATAQCLSALTLSLASSYAYTGRPVKFAQGNGTLVVSLPLPNTTFSDPGRAPSAAPIVNAPSAQGDQTTRPIRRLRSFLQRIWNQLKPSKRSLKR
jgi:hypothetical protein